MAGISHVCTISRVAEMLGEDEDLLREISIDMDPEDGCLTVLGPGDEATTAFTDHGIENLTELSRWSKPTLTCSANIRQRSDATAALTAC